MSYNIKKVTQKIGEEIKKERFNLETFAEMVGTSRQTLSNWLKSDMPLSKFLEICERLELEPSTFFLASNAGIIQTTSDSKNVSQTATNGTTEIDLLRQEVKHLKEKIELYERLLEARK